MTYEELDLMERDLDEEIVRRRKLGGYNADAETHLMSLVIQRNMVRHLKDIMPNPRIPLKDEKKTK